MKIGFIGMGKLGLPVALAVESRGHEVFGYDINPNIKEYIRNKEIPFIEEGIESLLQDTKIQIKSLEDVVLNSDIVFVPIQTPHEPEYEGATKLPETRKDFDYSYLIDGIKSIAEIAMKNKKKTILAVISTCLPTTYNEKIKPVLNEYIQYVYTPQFIAMGTVVNDYLDPEFALIGVEDEYASKVLQDFYKTLFDKPHIVTDITTAEGIKVSYNTWITAKTVIANAWGEIAHKTGMNFDDIFNAWSVSTKRLLSPRYMKAGMSDGGGCHPRDNIALSWLAEKINLSHNIFEDLMKSREDYEQWHADFAVSVAKENNMKLYILGKAFKPETNIETGSPAILMSNLISYPHEHITEISDVAVYFVATAHEKYRSGYPEGSLVIDPFGYVEHSNVIRIGRK